jgi:L-fuconolactonase
MVAETDWLLTLAGQNNRVFGVVGWLDLSSTGIADQIDEYAGQVKLKGVRHVIHDEPDDDFMLRDRFRHGISLLASAGLTFDLLLFPRHIARAIRLVDEFPNQSFVVDHIAKPRIADGVASPWDADLAELAKRENVWCKLSGMVTEAAPDWQPTDIVPYMDTVLESFGPDRLMIGSDWPVCTLAGDYTSVMNVVLTYIGKLSPSEQDAIAGGVCSRFYGIEREEQ